MYYIFITSHNSLIYDECPLQLHSKGLRTDHGLSKCFQRYLTTYVYISSQLPFNALRPISVYTQSLRIKEPDL